MPADDLSSKEILVRIISRLPEEVDCALAEEDFERRKKIKATGLPESGLSLLRLSKMTLPDMCLFVARKNNKPRGAAQIIAGELTKQNYKLVVGGKNNTHVSLRCIECDIKHDQAPCQPKTKDVSNCPLFDDEETKSLLVSMFTLIDQPALRNEQGKRLQEITANKLEPPKSRS